MEVIYKYTSLDSAIKIMKNNAVALNNPQNYNDPFDSVIDFDSNDIKIMESIILEYYLVQEFLKILNNKNIKVNPFIKFFMKWDRFCINLYLKKSKKNKYYDSIPGARALAKWITKYANKNGEKSFDELNEIFTREIVKKVKEARNNALISCFSKKYDSILMWSHYGDKHKGICFEFDRPNNDFFDVKYSRIRCKFDLEDTTRRVLGYMLSNEKVDVNDKELIRCISRPFIIKSSDYKYEEEVRCILSSTSDGVIIRDGIALFIMPTKIKKAYVGCKVDKSSKEYSDFLMLANYNNIDVIELIESNKGFNLKIANENLSS